MDLKLRISIYFSLVLFLLLGGFSFVVYRGVHNKLISAADQSLSAHMEHEWKHLEFHEGVVGEPLKSQDIYQRIWKDDTLLYDSFPPKWESQWRVSASGLGEGQLMRRMGRVLGDHHYAIEGVYDLSTTVHYLAALRNVLLLGGFLAVVMILPLSWIFARWVLRPFRELSRKTMELSAEQLSFRFPDLIREDEYGVLVRSFNILLGRLDKSFRQVRRFASNVSHELRTPLTVIRGEAEVTLRRSREPREYEAAMERILAHSETLQETISRLLYLAEVERMREECPNVLIDVEKATSETLGSLRALGAERQVAIDGSKLVYLGQPGLFNSVLRNLVENAFKFSKSCVRIGFSKKGASLILCVEDDGIGIAPELRSRVFDPLSNLEVSTGNRKAGHGLGLSIVKACVESVKGHIELGSSTLGGLKAEVLLPGPCEE